MWQTIVKLKLLSKVMPGLLVIQIQIQAMWNTFFDKENPRGKNCNLEVKITNILTST